MDEMGKEPKETDEKKEDPVLVVRQDDKKRGNNVWEIREEHSQAEEKHIEDGEQTEGDKKQNDEKIIGDEDIESDISESSISDLDDERSSPSEIDDDSKIEVPLTDSEIEGLIAEFLEVESKAAEAQESLEKESLAQVESEVRSELAEILQGDDLEKAVFDEMVIFKEEWEQTLDDLETESALLLEQLDGAGVELPSLYKWIENQAPNGCCTEAWKKRAHWVGSQSSSEVLESIKDAENYLQSCRPLKRRHGRLLEEGASGFLAKRFEMGENRDNLSDNSEKNWTFFNGVFQSNKLSEDSISFGSKHWASVYLASTPHQAAEMGLQLPGVDEVEEINDIECSDGDPFYADAVANEKQTILTEEQKKNFKKVKEEDDIKIARSLQFHLKRRRKRNGNLEEAHHKEVVTVEDSLEARLEGVEYPMLNKVNGHVLADPNNNISIHSSYHETDDLAGVSVHHSNDFPIDNGCDSKDASFSSVSSEFQRYRYHCDAGNVDEENKKRDNDILDFEGDVEKNAISLNDSQPETQLLSQDNDSVGVLDVTSRPNFSPNGSLLYKRYDSKSFRCTICSILLQEIEVYSHPLLEVIVCEGCKCHVEQKMQQKDPDCSECFCGWCGRCDDLISCSTCKTLFCCFCLRKHFGEERFSERQRSGWECFNCHPYQLRDLVSECEHALKLRGLLISSSDNDSNLSEANIEESMSNKKRRKRKIRRILDDAELGEETKKKIAIEKERQEHLKSMQFQSSSETWSRNLASCTVNVIEGDGVELLGDATMGYIVNVAREKDEEPVRIPPSMSAKLKPHQVVGIRFMWENIIQSLKKVKSGDKGLGCILAHTMGLGKTFQVIALLYTAMRRIDLGLRTAIIVTPVNVLHNWRQEFVKWQPIEVKQLRVFMLEDVSREKRVDLLAKWRRKGGVLLIGYTAFRNLSLGRHVKDRNVALEICNALQNGPDILVCDEAHMIKNTRADITHALKQVSCQRRIALTGSPLQNNLMEYYCMVDFVREGFLGSSHEFRNRFQNPIQNGQHTNSTSDDVKIMNQRSHILYEQLKGFVQRMDMNVVKKDLPPKIVYVITVKLSPLQRTLYKRFLDVHGFRNGQVSCDRSIRNRCFFSGYQALAQIWNHPGLLQLAKEHKDSLRREDRIENFMDEDSSSDENMERDIVSGDKLKNKNDWTIRKNGSNFFHEVTDWWEDLLQDRIYKEADYSGKMVLLLDILTMSSEVGDKALVFSQSLTTLDLIELFLSKLARKGRPGKIWKHGKDWYRLDGSTDGSERQKLVEMFNDPMNTRVKCLLISTKAGSLGINLHAANRVVVVDGSWNPTNDLQAIYRAWRYGQNKPVYAYRLMAHGTMEEKIYKRQVTKEGLAARVVDRQQIYRTMSKEEVLHLFDFGEDENSDVVHENGIVLDQDMLCKVGGLVEKKDSPLPNGSNPSDKIMEKLLKNHQQRWIANFHEHEALLQENEEERLTKEEQDMAWEIFRKSLEWKEVQKVSLNDQPTNVSFSDQKATHPITSPTVENNIYSSQSKENSYRNRSVQRKCTNLAHLLTLRSQGTKSGNSTICGECAEEISWERLNRDGRTR